MAPSLPSSAAVVVAGGGPAGFMAAIAAAEAGVGEVHILEATPEPLHKVLISGGGRCNVTHACWDPRALAGHYPRGNRALRGPFSRFAAADAVAWFDARGLELVEEPDGRMFPRANRSSAVIAVLRQAAAHAGVSLHTGVTVRDAVALPQGGFGLGLRAAGAAVGAVAAERITCRRLVLATGSHPSGRRLATQLGHGLVPPVPSLFSLALADQSLRELAGLVVDPVELNLQLPPAAGTGGERFRQVGPVLITHWGLSGPASLRLTAFAARALHAAGYRAELTVRWSGGRSRAELEELLADARRQQARRQLGNGRPWPELPRRLWLHLLDQAGVDADLRWGDLSRAAGRLLVERLLASRYHVSGRGPFGEEFVTAGGVPLGEVNLASMESRRCPGLFLVGELLDVDGITGGFNFQHCWSSGWLAGQALFDLLKD
ncbi:MAG: NAD(P)/FAD-dependent oxidoreductase [Cyanobacteriota bacterium]|nr:NAD(P)/FAD-dependent oxidoreductase [Cyanobacteriota bacterium]